MVEGESNNNKGNSKRHKTNEKSIHFAVRVSPSIFGIFEKIAHYT